MTEILSPPICSKVPVKDPLVSIIINNYNYGSFLLDAIDSAIHQTYPSIEIIIVDDGSTDGSTHKILSCPDPRIIPVFKENGGQASALNAGVRRSQGEIICFLDADDIYFPDKVTHIVKRVVENDIGSKPVLIHHYLEIVNGSAARNTGSFMGNAHKSPRNLYGLAKKYRFIPFDAGPTSSISLTRPLVDLLFPLPEGQARAWADEFIVLGASLIGELISLESVLGCYRVHGSNAWFNSDRTKSREFVETLDEYLNLKLTNHGHLPVISFYDSMYCWNQLVKEKRWTALLVGIFNCVLRQRDALTLRFINDTLRQVFNASLRKYSVLNWIAAVTKSLRHGAN
jgi:glycosyltransferase involved in cell wall biosynthesis